MDVVDFVREFSRMCDEYNTCRGCPMDGICVPCTEAVYKDPQGVVEIVEKWGKEHPIKTNAMKFEEVFGFIPRCRDIFDTNNNIHHKPWWDAPYKAPKEGNE